MCLEVKVFNISTCHWLTLKGGVNVCNGDINMTALTNALYTHAASFSQQLPLVFFPCVPVLLFKMINAPERSG